MNPAERIIAVVIAYNPDQAALICLLTALRPQVSAGIVINNGTSLPLNDQSLRACGFEVRHLGANQGVAAALNVGATWALEQGADFLLALDQDSEPLAGMVYHLQSAYYDLSAKGHLVAAVGPQTVDRASGRKAPFVRPCVWSRISVIPAQNQSVEVDHLITSGCLIPITAWVQIGPFMDSLFIDYVDIEWCLRARSRGLSLFGIANAVLLHRLGDKAVLVRGRPIPWHVPLRHYYLFRNAVLLWRLAYIPFGWKLVDAWLLFKRLVFISVVAPLGGGHCKAIWTGLWDGVSRVSGKTRRKF